MHAPDEASAGSLGLLLALRSGSDDASRMRNLLLSLVFACGGATPAEETTPQDEEPVAETNVDIEEPEPEPEAEPELEPEPPSGPGQIHVINKVDGEDGGGTVQVLSAEGEVVAEGNSGDTFTVDSGQYQVAGTITDTSVLIDTPTDQGDSWVEVLPGEVAEAHIDHGRARVRIRVMRNGRALSRWRMEVTRRGSTQSITLQPSNDYIPISAGRYSGVVTFGAHRIEVSDLIFQAGAQRDMPINVN